MAVRFQRGRFRWIDLDTKAPGLGGWYRLTGDVIVLTSERACCGGVVRRGETTPLRWSVYRDRLVFTELPGRTEGLFWAVKPFTRIR
jgi:hypothetical protein